MSGRIALAWLPLKQSICVFQLLPNTLGLGPEVWRVLAKCHNIRNLGEYEGELTEIFQWMTEAQSRTAGANPEVSQAVRDELADVLLYLVRLASVLEVDLNEAVQHKLQRNAKKYPVDKARGSNKKYTEL